MAYQTFIKLTDNLFIVQQCQHNTELNWNQIRPLLVNLQDALKDPILEEQQDKFIEYLLKYMELVLGFLSSFTTTQYASSNKYANKLLDFLPESLAAKKLCNFFVTTSTMGLLDMLVYMNFSTFANRHLLSVFNRIVEKCDKKITKDVGTASVPYIFKLLDLLTTYGNFSLQCDVLETLFRLYSHLIKSEKLKYKILPDLPELSAALATDISVNNFDSDIRLWLNKLNRNSPYIFSLKCLSVMLGDSVCKPQQDEFIWLDFNLKDQELSFGTAAGENNTEWALLYIPAQYAKSVEVSRSTTFTETQKTTITMVLSKPCISNNPHLFKSMEKIVQIIISAEEKDQLTRLVAHVLPKMFGKTFQHTSSRASVFQKRVYRPLRNISTSGSRVSKSPNPSSRYSPSTSRNSDSEMFESIRSSSSTKSNEDAQIASTSKTTPTISTRTETPTTEGPIPNQPKLATAMIPTASTYINNALDITDFTRTDSNAVTSRPVTPESDNDSENLIDSSISKPLVATMDIHQSIPSPASDSSKSSNIGEQKFPTEEAIAVEQQTKSTHVSPSEFEIGEAKTSSETGLKELLPHQSSFCITDDSESSIASSTAKRIVTTVDIHQIIQSPAPGSSKPSDIGGQKLSTEEEMPPEQQKKTAMFTKLPDLDVIDFVPEEKPTSKKQKECFSYSASPKISVKNCVTETAIATKNRTKTPTQLTDADLTQSPDCSVKSFMTKDDVKAKKETKKAIPPRTLFRVNSFSYLENLNLDKSTSEPDSQTTQTRQPKNRRPRKKETAVKKTKNPKRKRERKKSKSKDLMFMIKPLPNKTLQDITNEAYNFCGASSLHSSALVLNETFYDVVAREITENISHSTPVKLPTPQSQNEVNSDSQKSSGKYSLPELEIEPIGGNVWFKSPGREQSTPKIKILQNITIANPKRSLPPADDSSISPSKRFKMVDDSLQASHGPVEHSLERSERDSTRDVFDTLFTILSWAKQRNSSSENKLNQVVLLVNRLLKDE